MYYHVRQEMAGQPSRLLTINELVETFRYAKNYAQEHFGKSIIEGSNKLVFALSNA